MNCQDNSIPKPNYPFFALHSDSTISNFLYAFYPKLSPNDIIALANIYIQYIISGIPYTKIVAIYLLPLKFPAYTTNNFSL